MAQKNAHPNKEQSQIITKNGLQSYAWVVVKDLPSSMIIKNRITGEFKHIEK